jgi:hypothetical protein
MRVILGSLSSGRGIPTLANLQRTIGLWMKEKTGLTATVLILFAIAVLAALLGVIFLCVSAYEWAAIELGPVFGGLASAGVFLAIADAASSLPNRSGVKRSTAPRSNAQAEARAPPCC